MKNRNHYTTVVRIKMRIVYQLPQLRDKCRHPRKKLEHEPMKLNMKLYYIAYNGPFSVGVTEEEFNSHTFNRRLNVISMATNIICGQLFTHLPHAKCQIVF